MHVYVHNSNKDNEVIKFRESGGNGRSSKVESKSGNDVNLVIIYGILRKVK